MTWFWNYFFANFINYYLFSFRLRDNIKFRFLFLFLYFFLFFDFRRTIILFLSLCFLFSSECCHFFFHGQLSFFLLFISELCRFTRFLCRWFFFRLSFILFNLNLDFTLIHWSSDFLKLLIFLILYLSYSLLYHDSFSILDYFFLVRVIGLLRFLFQKLCFIFL